MTVQDELQVLLDFQFPTENPVTDNFGLGRDWTKTGWNPQSAYSPIHEGIDFSAKPDEKITMPFDGMVYGDTVGGLIGTYIMLIPTGCKHIAFYFFHCEPTPAEWKPYKKGDVITKHAGHGIGAPHLHMTIAVTEDLGYIMKREGMFLEESLGAAVAMKCHECGYPFELVMNRIHQQRTDQGIESIHKDYIVRSFLPDYRRSQHSEVGIGKTWLINPMVIHEA